MGVCLLSSLIFWGSSTPSRSVNYADSLFLVVSAMTLAGLNTINLSQLNTFQQIVLFLLILLGSAIWISIAVLHIRRKAFERKFKSIVEAGRQRRRDRSNSRGGLTSPDMRRPSLSDVNGKGLRGSAINAENGSSREENNEGLHGISEHPSTDVPTAAILDYTANMDSDAEGMKTGHRNPEAAQPLSIDTGLSRRITFADPTSPTRERHHARIFSMQGVGARQNIQNHPLKTPPPIYPNELLGAAAGEAANGTASHHGFLSSGFIGRNSQFAGLSLAERERLGGVEYRAVSILAVLVPAYFILWQLFGCIGLGAYVAYNRSAATDLNAENPWCDQF